MRERSKRKGKVDIPEAYTITQSDLETLCNVRSRMNAPERLDYDQRRTLAVRLETIIDVAKMNPYQPNANLTGKQKPEKESSNER